MGLFKRKPNPDKELASALAQRGVAGRATVVAMTETGAIRAEVAREVEFTLDLALPDGSTVRTVHRQFMNRFTLHGLAPGEPASVMYDREDPRTVMVQGHPRFRTDVVAGEIVIVELQDLDAPA
ncbi:hypothetical protein Q5424_08130 [Conexibacter sp. JD483]|uniref:hypothetical protein n=1 Tax=unclassified Conexibacter TaxID=2627773 RepID=UPI00271FBCB0|nr:MULTISPECIES: hypothetical protein [unclassified Conexibacter]MDO8183994.1 hypothetical protein [Conexibacter sp. CPCC 205706]MDO8196986.1 hypothetical protein [Conexibacter sp. CPCC 205762]MDR9369044.1 hypothetical protein [Conexibacter sp. JD483]